MTFHAVEWNAHYGPYRFEVWFDSGNECGLEQRDVYVRERTPIERVPLTSVPGRLLLTAYRGADRAAREVAFGEAVAQVEAQFAPALQTPAQASALAQPPAQQDKAQRRRKKKQRRAAQMEQGRAIQALVEALRKELAVLPREQFDLERLALQVERYDETRFLRSFYFDEVNESHIRNFCRKYATVPAYRAEVDAGTTPWARRNALFVRNLLAMPPTTELAAERLWGWLCDHAEAILALPDYARLQQCDTAFDPQMSREYDPEIRAAVAAWNQVSGVETRWSCQGVSDVVTYHGHQVFAVTPHVAHAYIEFATFSAPAADAVRTLAPSYPTVQIVEETRLSGAGNDRQTERSIVQIQSTAPTANLAFRQDCIRLAEEVRQRLCP